MAERETIVCDNCGKMCYIFETQEELNSVSNIDGNCYLRSDFVPGKYTHQHKNHDECFYYLKKQIVWEEQNSKSLKQDLDHQVSISVDLQDKIWPLQEKLIAAQQKVIELNEQLLK